MALVWVRGAGQIGGGAGGSTGWSWWVHDGVG